MFVARRVGSGAKKTAIHSLRRRSEGVRDVLEYLLDGEWKSRVEVEVAIGTKSRNARRILAGLVRYGQVGRRVQKRDGWIAGHGGRKVPIQPVWLYKITERGVGRLDWLKKNRPWEV